MRSIRHLQKAGPLGLIGFALLLTCLVSWTGTVLAQDDDEAKDENGDKVTYRVTGDVYHGDKNKFSKPCVLRRNKIFEKIPAYQTIKRERLNKNSARYYFLIEKANKVFFSKIKEALEDMHYDLVVEKNGIKAKGVKIPDITSAVIKKITG